MRTAGIALDFERDPLHREIARAVRLAPEADAALIEARAYTPLSLLAQSRLAPAVGTPRVRDTATMRWAASPPSTTAPPAPSPTPTTHQATEQRTTTVVHEPASFVPLLRIEHATPADDKDEDDREMRAALDQVGALCAEYGIELPAELREATPDAQVRFLLTDHLGTPLGLIDAEGRTEPRRQQHV